MRASTNRLSGCAAILLCVFAAPGSTNAQSAPSVQLIQQLESQFGLTDRQVRGALGALLVYVRERLPKKDFDDFSQRIPNAAQIMQDVKLQGIVTKPLDTIDDYEASLASLGIGQPLASQFAPAVVKHLGDAGYYRERDILARALN
ncbi:hypothetical protein HNQ60_004110 [Povalibacter uvarum]|uniref:DUF1400 domain-containing protein n=1 Tax=Povalibacter uvarum TaxID=732238 RepID=A0A841HSM9_9GAMM|nr:DUF2780 domain-containing protein [Povalibacter uvarum]MBB6095220.1 hypothetical protein [Povalibacter uvarum]